MKVSVDREECISCASCWSTCALFEENPADGMCQIAQAHQTDGILDRGDVPSEMEECAEEAADLCPMGIIHID